MARVDEPFKMPSRLTPMRLLVLILFMAGITISGGYMVLTPVTQLYWGMYARVNPMKSDTELARNGRILPRKGLNGDGDLDNQAGLVEPTKTTTIEQQQQPVEEEPEQQYAGQEEPEPQQPQESHPHALTKELALKTAGGPDGVVVLTWANFHYRDFVMNWVEHLQATGCTSYLVGAMDDDLLNVLLEHNIPCFSMRSGLSTEDFGWGSAQFHKMGREKIALIKTFTNMGVHVFISDVDTVWMRNPVEYAQRYPDADILTSSDGLTCSVQDESIEIWERQMAAANIGIMLFRPKAAELANEWMEVLDKDDKVWDQNAFNDLFRRGWKNSGREDNLFYGYDGKLLMGILPVSLFSSGHTFFVQRMPYTMGLEPYVAHATFQYSGTEGKRNRFREFQLWNDADEYFTHPRGFISVNTNVPPELMEAPKNFVRDGTTETVERVHFRLMNHQLLALRALFAFAIVFDRAAVLPTLWCGMDRWWAGHEATIPGSDFALPYICPADHVLNLEVMENQNTPASWGPRIDWREYSFLDKSQAQHIVESTLRIYTCRGDEPDCFDGSQPATIEEGTHIVRLKQGLNEVQLLTALGPIINVYKRLHFEDAIGLWAGFDSQSKAQQFKERMDMMASIWCCIPNASPGHMWYDFFWDTVHKDRWNREWGVDEATKWRPLPGP